MNNRPASASAKATAAATPKMNEIKRCTETATETDHHRNAERICRGGKSLKASWELELELNWNRRD
jgi:hypothetical protein